MSQPSARRGRPPESVGSETLRRILDEATRLFARKGFHGTSVAEIGKAAGVQAGALYYHIKSKDELLWLILHDYVTDLQASIQAEVSAHADPVERLEAMLATHITRIIRFRRQVTIELRDRNALSKEHYDQLQRVRDDVQQLWQQTLDEGAASGVFRTSDRVVTNAVLTMASLVSQWYRRGGPHSPQEVARIITELVISGLAAPPERPR